MKRVSYNSPEFDIVVLSEESGLCVGSPQNGGSEDIGYISWEMIQ